MKKLVVTMTFVTLPFAACTVPGVVGNQDTVIVSNVDELVAAIERANAEGNLEILLEDGTYTLDDMLWVEGANVTVRSRSGNRDAVVIEGAGMYGPVSHVFNVTGDYFSSEDMTVGRVANHGIQIHGNADCDYPRVINLRFIDTGEQMLKVSYDPGNAAASNGGLVENCLFEYTAGVGPQYYIGGVDGHRAYDWTVRGNTFRFIRSPDGDLAEHAVHFWSDSRGTVVEKNVITDCDRGIGFGLGDSGHTGGMIRNNFVHTTRDVGIGLENAFGADVYNNSLYTEGYPNSIEYRFGGTSGASIINNLANAAITSRDGGSGTLDANVTDAAADWFVDPTEGDLHLASSVPSVVDRGETLVDVADDIDEQTRPQGPAYDIGADELP
ncbi:MAG: right-handed parallel beta-helix repeat-containing protein [Candidatus Coatesbacteria bacterium]|nr:MAG: right-handed parallel beta-helix repeat-containing protein [Candidatus Coatesbacteria bacterium]